MGTTLLIIAVILVSAVAMAVSNGVSKLNNLKRSNGNFSIEADSLVFDN
ncbi:MAG: hypothetical protein IJ150_07000 [Bacteroidales bacterium]|nr:hypothetical protein [Bacteroidales bacterium]